MRRFKFLSLVIAFAFTAMGAGLAQLPSSDVAGLVSSQIPGTYLVRSNSLVTTKYKTPVNWGDTLRTDGNGRAVLHLQDGSRISLAENSEVTIDRESGKTTLVLVSGVMRMENKATDVEVRTANAIVSANGGDYLFDATHFTRVLCVEGSARVSTTDRQSSFSCHANESVISEPGDPLVKAASLDEHLKGVLINATDPDAPLPATLPLP